MYKLLSDYSTHFYREKPLDCPVTLESTRFKLYTELKGIRYIAKMDIIIEYDTHEGHDEDEKVVTTFSFEDSLFPDEMLEKIYSDFEARWESMRPREKREE
jgi:hypothetical protein